MPDLSWRDRVAHAAAADVGRESDEKAIAQARRLAERWVSGTGVGLCAFAVLGAFSGYATTALLLRPVDGHVDAAAALLGIVGLPWLCLAVRGVAIVGLRWRASLLLDWVVPKWLLRGTGRSAMWDAPSRNLIEATARRIGDMVTEGSGHRLAAAASGTCWTVYALVAGVTIWVVTSRVAVGFSWEWESSWISPGFGRAVVEAAAGPLGALVDSKELTPVAPAPFAPADDPEALAVRQTWLRFLTAGVGVYILLPMAVWTMWQIRCMRRAHLCWRPHVVTVSRIGVTPATHPPEPIAAPRRAPFGEGGVCTHVVRLERPEEPGALSAPLDRLADLGDVDSTDDLERVLGSLSASPGRVAVIGWLPSTPDRAIERRLRTLVTASTEAPLLVLDGAKALQRTESPHTTKIRLDDWRTVASATGVTAFECDLAHLSDADHRDLAGAVGHQGGGDGGHEADTESGAAKGDA